MELARMVAPGIVLQGVLVTLQTKVFSLQLELIPLQTGGF
jgi:hypothetical protein